MSMLRRWIRAAGLSVRGLFGLAGRRHIGTLPGLMLLGGVTVLAVLLSWWASDQASVGYWGAQLAPVSYGLLAWWASHAEAPGDDDE